jgi:hypothetical protein
LILQCRARSDFHMALPDSTETPRTRHLQNIVDAVSADDLSEWPMLTSKDYELVGAYVVLFSYVEFNLRRVVELFDKKGLLTDPWKGKSEDLHATDLAAAAQSLQCWDDGGRKALAEVEELRKFRNLAAHFAIRRFPNDDAFLFVAKSKRDFKRVFGSLPPDDAALTAVVDCTQVRGALRHVEHVQNWLATVTAKLEQHLDP